MKFSTTTALILSLLSQTTMAFSPSSLDKSTMKSEKGTSSAVATMDLDGVSNTNKNKVLYDPLGLYPKDAPERIAGLIQPLESSVVSNQDDTNTETNIIIDPLGLYRNQEGEQQHKVSEEGYELSASLPFLRRPKYLDGTMPGDRGFDPFNFASSPEALLKYRNSELKHARLAMLATIGWPIAELFHNDIANTWNMPTALNIHDRVPSILNGGLDKVSPIFWIVALATAASIETLSGSVDEIQSPNLGFDPLGLSSKKSQFMEESEIFNGRLAMLAITGFAIQEWFTGNSVVDAIPIFFKPFNVVMEQLLTTGGDAVTSL